MSAAKRKAPTKRKAPAKRTAKLAPPKTVEVTVVKGGTGWLTLYVNGHRVVGEKPWGGRREVALWRMPQAEFEKGLKKALSRPGAEKKR